MIRIIPINVMKERFSLLQDFEGANLLDISAKDYGDYARQLLRVLYDETELCSSILPSSFTHYARKALDKTRFALFHSKFIRQEQTHFKQVHPNQSILYFTFFQQLFVINIVSVQTNMKIFLNFVYVVNQLTFYVTNENDKLKSNSNYVSHLNNKI